MAVDINALSARIGESFGPGDWLTIDQPVIDAFAELTLDRQWIHIDPDRARSESPFGGTVAHGLLIASLIPHLIEGAPWLLATMGVNYGIDHMRFITPVTAGSRIRAQSRLERVEAYGERGARIATKVTVEIEGASKPACVAEMIGLLLD